MRSGESESPTPFPPSWRSTRAPRRTHVVLDSLRGRLRGCWVTEGLGGWLRPSKGPSGFCWPFLCPELGKVSEFRGIFVTQKAII